MAATGPVGGSKGDRVLDLGWSTNLGEFCPVFCYLKEALFDKKRLRSGVKIWG